VGFRRALSTDALLDFAWRFPSFVAALVLAVLVFRGARTFGDLPALYALAAFGLNLLSVRLATLVRTDMPLALVTFAVGLLMFEKSGRERRGRHVIELCFSRRLSAAMFVKGPIVWAFVLPPLVLYQLRRNWRPDFPSAWSGCVPWIASFALFCLWVIFGIRFIDGFYEDVILNEFGRSLSSGHSSFAAATLLYSASAAKIRALEFAHPRIAGGRFAQNESGNRKVAGESLSRDVLADRVGAWRHRSDVIDSVEASGPNLPRNSSALLAPGCANQGDYGR